MLSNKIAFIVAIVLAGGSSAAPYSASGIGVYPVNLCPLLNSSLLNSYTGSALHGSSLAPWASASDEKCHSNQPPSAQSVTVDSFSRAQHNLDRWYPEVPRSNTYVLTVLREDSVKSAFIDVEILDATNTVVMPRMHVALGDINDHQPPVQPLLATRRTAPIKGKHSGKTQQRKLHRGRRKGKGGFMGGIGGGSRYGGGSGGFRSGGSSKSYGYSSSALSSRYAAGYKRTAYGYTGRSRVMPLFIFSGHRHGMHYLQSCDQYSGSSRARCQRSYNGTILSDGCEYTAGTPHQRDDLMMATVNNSATFPLTVRVHRAALLFHPTAQPEPWQKSLLFSFSEVDFDDEEDVVMPFWALCLLTIMGLLFCIACCTWCCCKIRARREASTRHEVVDAAIIVHHRDTGPPVAEYKADPGEKTASYPVIRAQAWPCAEIRDTTKVGVDSRVATV